MIAAPFGSSFEIILPMTDTLTVSNAATNLVKGTTQGAKTLTLPAISAMVASQNREVKVVNPSGGGGTITVAANAADSIIGRTTVAVANGATFYHDGLHTWFGI